jgi:hypothetical protein
VVEVVSYPFPVSIRPWILIRIWYAKLDPGPYWSSEFQSYVLKKKKGLNKGESIETFSDD